MPERQVRLWHDSSKTLTIYYCWIPAGVALSIVVVWVTSAAMRKISPQWFAYMPTWGISWISIAVSVLLGLLTVLLAARTPAKKAAKSSPLEAVSGNAQQTTMFCKAANTSFFKIETAMGVHHAKSNKKNYVLMTGAYGFLSIIVAITIFHIMNTINMGVIAKTKQYGTMRAIGMSNQQLIKMIVAEAMTYAVSGIILGCIIGLPMHWVVFASLITNFWGTAWSIPIFPLALIIGIVLFTSFLAVRSPAKRLHDMAIVDTIKSQQ